jgi:hypothetical protein
MRKVKGGCGGWIYLKEKGECSNPKGRPRKILSTLKAEGYKKSQVNETIDKILTLKDDEFNDIEKDPDTTQLEKICARMIRKGKEKGDGEILEYIISKKTIKDDEPSALTESSISMPEDPIAASKKYQELMKNEL